jgi:predicted HD phosphohydrolase
MHEGARVEEQLEAFDVDYIADLYNLMIITQGVEQEQRYHPEGDVWTHSFQALGIALRECIDTDLIMAAWLHDIGKSVQREGHEKHSVKLLEDLISPKSLWLIEQHMRIRTWLSGEMQAYKKVRDMAQHPWLPLLIHLRRIDASARKPGRVYEITPEVLTGKLNYTLEEHFGRNQLKKEVERRNYLGH